MKPEKSALIFTKGEWDVFLCSGGVIKKLPKTSGTNRTQFDEAFKYVCACYGLQTKNFRIVDRHAEAFMNCKNLREFEQYAVQKIEEKNKGREKREKEKNKILQERAYLHEKFTPGDMITGFSQKDIVMFDTGFSLSINLNTQYSRKKQIVFCKENQKEIVKYAWFRLRQQEYGRMKKCAGMIPYIKPDEMIVGTNEVTIIFELKESLQNILSKINRSGRKRLVCSTEKKESDQR